MTYREFIANWMKLRHRRGQGAAHARETLKEGAKVWKQHQATEKRRIVSRKQAIKMMFGAKEKK